MPGLLYPQTMSYNRSYSPPVSTQWWRKWNCICGKGNCMTWWNACACLRCFKSRLSSVSTLPFLHFQRPLGESLQLECGSALCTVNTQLETINCSVVMINALNFTICTYFIVDGSVASCHSWHKSRPLWHMLVFLHAAGHILPCVCEFWQHPASAPLRSAWFLFVWSRLASDDSPQATPAWLWTANSSGSRAHDIWWFCRFNQWVIATL